MLLPTNQQQPRWLQGKRIGILFGFLLTVLLAGAAGSVYETFNLFRANQWVIHALEVLNSVEQLCMEMHNAEGAQRGYVIIADETSQNSYRRASEQINDLLPQLVRLTSDNPRQQQHLEQLEPLVVEYLEFSAGNFAIRQQSGFDAARQRIASGKGTQILKAADEVVEAMRDEESRLFRQRSETSNWAAGRLLAALSASTFIAMALLGLVYRMVRRDRIQRAEAAEKFRLVVESCPTGIVMVDRLGRIALVNSETERLFGYSRAEVLGQPIELLVPQRFRPEHPQFLQKYMAKPEARSMGIGRDLFGLRKDGSEFPVEIGLHPTPSKDGLLVLAAIVDITERKQREDERRRFTARLQQSNRELQDFAYVSSHDLQEPLRKIQAFGDRLKISSKTLSEQGRDCVDRMQKAAARMRVLIEDLLKFSRVTSKAQPFMAINLNEVVHEVLDDLEVRISTSGAQVSVGRLPEIDADPLQMRQLFQNLIGNALKFNRPQTTPAIDIRADVQNGDDVGPEAARCEIIVADNGIGFDNKYAQRIFDVFQRLHERDQYEGSGIGLSICRKIVERHSGSITADGRPGEGATFVVTLPVHQVVTDIESETAVESQIQSLQEATPCPHVEEAFNC